MRQETEYINRRWNELVINIRERIRNSILNCGWWSNNGEGFFYVNDLVLWDHDNNPGAQKYLFAALGASSVRSKFMTSTFLDLNKYGLYRSTDGGNFCFITAVNNGPGVIERSMILRFKKF